MAESYLNVRYGDRFIAQSAGLEPGTLNPVVVEAMKEDGVDISDNKTKSVFVFSQRGDVFDYVITVCDESSAKQCPSFPQDARRAHWSFDDPSQFQGSYQEKLHRVRELRGQVRSKIDEWVREIELGR